MTWKRQGLKQIPSDGLIQTWTDQNMTWTDHNMTLTNHTKTWTAKITDQNIFRPHQSMTWTDHDMTWTNIDKTCTDHDVPRCEGAVKSGRLFDFSGIQKALNWNKLIS